MKRKLSFLIAAIMVLSLLPAMSVSAKTTNDIAGGVMSVSSDYSWADGPVGQTPILRIKKADDNTKWADMSFSLELEGAKWVFADYDRAPGLPNNQLLLTGSNTLSWRDDISTLFYDKSLDPGDLWDGDGMGSDVDWQMDQVTDRYVDVTLTTDASATFDDDGVLHLPLCVQMTGEGTARVKIIDPTASSGLSFGGSYAFATAYAGATKTTVEGTVTSSNIFDLKQVTITETRSNTLNFAATNGGHILLTAPSGFKWDFGANTVDNCAMPTATVRAAAGFTAVVGAPATDIVYKYGSDDTTVAIYYNATNAPGAPVAKFINTDVVQFPTSSQRPGAIVIQGLKLRREGTVSETNAGEMHVRVSLTGGTTESILVGYFASRSMEMTAEDKALPEIVSGVYKRDHFAESTQVLDVTLKELVAGAWNDNFEAVLTLTDGVKFRAVQIIDESNTQLSKNDYRFLNSTQGGAGGTTSGFISLSDTKLALKPNGSTQFRDSSKDPTKDSMMVKMRIYVTVKPGVTGEIKLFTHEDTEGFAAKLEATVAKAINPFEVTAAANDVQLGYMNIKMSDITVKENQAGAIRRTGSSNIDAYFDFGVSPSGGFAQPDGYLFWIGGYSGYWSDGRVPFKAVDKFEYISGDIVLDKIGISDGKIKLDVKRSSTTPSEFKIVGIKLDADRTIPEGKLELRAGGAAASNWYGSATGGNRDYGSFDADSFNARPDYINIITAAPDKDTKYTTEVEVTIGSTKLIANGVEVQPEMDVAPFIQDGYTMVPVRAVSVALGVSDDQVIWNGATKTVTILDTGRGRQAQFTANSNYITISGGMQVPFEGPSCMIKDGRAFLPFRALGEIVLACPVSWNDETKTAYFNEGGSNAQANAAAPAAAPAADAAE